MNCFPCARRGHIAIAERTSYTDGVNRKPQGRRPGDSATARKKARGISSLGASGQPLLQPPVESAQRTAAHVLPSIVAALLPTASFVMVLLAASVLLLVLFNITLGHSFEVVAALWLATMHIPLTGTTTNPEITSVTSATIGYLPIVLLIIYATFVSRNWSERVTVLVEDRYPIGPLYSQVNIPKSSAGKHGVDDGKSTIQSTPRTALSTWWGAVVTTLMWVAVTATAFAVVLSVMAATLLDGGSQEFPISSVSVEVAAMYTIIVHVVIALWAVTRIVAATITLSAPTQVLSLQHEESTKAIYIHRAQSYMRSGDTTHGKELPVMLAIALGLHIASKSVRAVLACGLVCAIVIALFHGDTFAQWGNVSPQISGQFGVIGVSLLYVLNIVIAVVAILVGSTIVIGQGSYSLAATSASALPPLPVFAALPNEPLPVWAPALVLLVVSVGAYSAFVMQWRVFSHKFHGVVAAASALAVWSCMWLLCAGSEGEVGTLGDVTLMSGATAFKVTLWLGLGWILGSLAYSTLSSRRPAVPETRSVAESEADTDVIEVESQNSEQVVSRAELNARYHEQDSVDYRFKLGEHKDAAIAEDTGLSALEDAQQVNVQLQRKSSSSSTKSTEKPVSESELADTAFTSGKPGNYDEKGTEKSSGSEWDVAIDDFGPRSKDS